MYIYIYIYISDCANGLIQNYISRRRTKLPWQKSSWRIRSDILMGGGTNIGLLVPPSPPIPIPGVAKVPCQGAEQLFENAFLNDFQ